MTTELSRIAVKPTDYKVCTTCKTINWNENENCHSCNSESFDSSLVLGYVEDEYNFYENEEGYSESEVDNIEVVVA